ncbi:uncharacterized protein DUF1080 [Chitinophaga skermanii]|uniref:Uncharacterized protein DUF1080 n=1 Tax=Chitinophaga skermanii TaxID=331697 RepID=A0A327R3W0_9BACT|nr:DUF1080 domain-containing protein [Chitinophaga skermanii]RAJ10738.1 uncharacterized protein DUF1080 [Chitinophaga skermanii]
MKRFFSTALVVGAILYGSTAFAQNNQLTKKEKKAGWQLLFDGTSTKGWHSYNKTTVGEGWKIEDGALVLDKKEGEKGGDLTTDAEYTNYEFQVDWKISEGGNSGIIFGVKEDAKYGAPYLTGPEMQVLDDAKHADGKIYKHNSGDLYDMIASAQKAAKPVGEWNTAKIVKDHNKLSLYLNGVKTVETVIGSNEWKELVAGSKFKKWEGFGAFETGKIALQDHGDKVWYRNIKIKVLK